MQLAGWKSRFALRQNSAQPVVPHLVKYNTRNKFSWASKHLSRLHLLPRITYVSRRQNPLRPIAATLSDDSQYTEDEVDDLVMDAASFICVMDDLRPLEPDTYNPFYELWTRIERIPPEARHRLLDELEPGTLRSLWRASMARYVLDEARSLELFSAASVWDDFPLEPGQVFVYEGRCERYELEGPGAVRFREVAPTNSYVSQPGTPAAPWLQPAPGSFEVPVTRFTQLFFVPPFAAAGAAAGEEDAAEADVEEEAEEDQEAAEGPPVFSRVLLPLVGPIDRWWEPIYCRLRVGLTLTPLPRDAGADLLLLYPSDPDCDASASAEDKFGDPDRKKPGDPASVPQAAAADGGGSDANDGGAAAAVPAGAWTLVGRECLPAGLLWPAPEPQTYSVSPFSGEGRDYMRVVGPGVYVGCAYRRAPNAKRLEYLEEDCVYFVIARKV